MDDATDVREAAARALESIDIDWTRSGIAQDTVPELVAIIEDRSSRRALHTYENRGVQVIPVPMRTTAATLLGRIGDARATDALIAAVQSNWGGNVRWMAAEMLGKIKDPRAIEPLLGALIDTEYVVCKAAARALLQIDVDWAASAVALAAVPRFKKALEESELTSKQYADDPEPTIPDREIAVRAFRHDLRVAGERDSKTVSWAAKEALRFVGVAVDEPGSAPRQ